MTLLVVVSDLEFGGGQAFAVRLAQALARDSRVLIASIDPARVDERFTARIGPSVTLVRSTGGAEGIARIVADERVSAINSHLWFADRLVLEALRDTNGRRPIRWTVSMHGCYEIMLEHPEAEPEFPQRAAAVLTSADHVVIAAEKNRRVFERLGLPQDRVERIPYGFEPTAPTFVRRPEADVVFGVVARAFPTKGWEEAVVAFRAVRVRLRERGLSSALVLVGDGPVADALAPMREPDVIVTGWNAAPEEHIAGFDVAMLPTSFAGESFPNAIIEYCAQGKPVIATRWAEIPAMLGEAGVLIDLEASGRADVVALRDAMIDLALDAPRRRALGAAALARSRSFSMPECAARYRGVLFDSRATTRASSL